MTSARRIITSTVLVAAILCTAFMAFAAQNFDFHAFYCAGAVARTGGDPYLAQPLGTCEASVSASPFAQQMSGTTLPAPFPGYVIAAMEAVSWVPFGVASKLWTAAIVIAMIACVVLLMRLTSLGAPFIAAALCLSVGVTSLGFGEVAPFALAALCAAALFAKSGRWSASAVAAGVCLIEPHLGLPVCMALALWRPRARAALAIVAISLAALSLAALGWNENLEYFARVLPYHALSEIGSNRQFSASVIVHALGGTNDTALRVGLWSYIVMALVGVIAAQRAAIRLNNGAFLVLVPAAIAMIGGAFVHVTQIAAAIPLVLLLLRQAREYRGLLCASLTLLAIPWLWIYEPVLIVLAAVFAFYLVWETTSYNAATASYCAIGVLVALFAVNAWSGGHAPRGAATPRVRVAIPAEYAEASWAKANLGYWSSGSAVSWAYRIPTWCGLLAVAGTVGLAVRRRKVEALSQCAA